MVVTPVCKIDDDCDEKYCCLGSGVICESDEECCSHEKCRDDFGGSDLVPKQCTGDCGATESSCTSESDCCGGGEVRSCAESCHFPANSE